MSPTPEQLARHDFISFIRYMRPDLMIPKHWIFIAWYLERMMAGFELRLIIEVPIRHGKTEECHRLWPPFIFGHRSTRQVLSATHKDSLAIDCGRDIRNYVDSDPYRELFPGVTLAPDSKAKGLFHVRKKGVLREGVLKTIGRSGDASGIGADPLIIDDLLGETEAHSEAAKEEARIMLRALIRRLEPNAPVLIIQSRVAEDDPAGYALQAWPLEGFKVLRFPAIAEEDESHAMPDGSTWTRNAGEALWPERYPLARLEQLRAQLPAHEWSSSYQQRPIPIGSLLVDEAWFVNRRYTDDPDDILKRSQRTVVSLDTSKGTATGARTGLGIWAEDSSGAYRVGGDAERWQVPIIIDRLKAICNRVKPHAVLIEDKSTGEAIIQILRADPDWKWPIVAIMPPAGMDKIVRFAASTPAMREGYMWLPRKAHPLCLHWQPMYEDQLFRYPNCTGKDLGDETSQYLNWRRENPLPPTPTRTLGAIALDYSARLHRELEVF